MADAREPGEWVRRMREIARQDAEELVPRPDFGVLRLAAAGPHVVATEAEAELPRAIDAERNRLVDHAGVDEEEPASPPEFERTRLPLGEALICRHGAVWAARVLEETGVSGGEVVTIVGRGVAPELIRLSPAGDLRPFFEARNEILGQLTERRRHAAPPVLEPAQGVAAFRALAEHTLDQHARLLESTRDHRLPRHLAGDPALYRALWRRAVREQQRLAGIDAHAADDAVTLVVNHLGQLLEDATWFADPRLRAAAIDETLRHAMLGDDVPSLPAQQAWERYRTTRLAQRWRLDDPADMLADVRAGQPVATAWLAAWAAWAERA